MLINGIYLIFPTCFGLSSIMQRCRFIVHASQLQIRCIYPAHLSKYLDVFIREVMLTHTQVMIAQKIFSREYCLSLDYNLKI